MINKYKEYLANISLGLAAFFTAIDKFVIENREINALGNFLLFFSIALLIDSSKKKLFWKLLHYAFICLTAILLVTQLLMITGLVKEKSLI